MADTYEQNLGQKSSLTTSDYIRVVGSDNVSYKQLVSAVADTIVPTTAKLVSENTFVTSLSTYGLYYCRSWTDSPSGVSLSGYLLVLPHATAGATFRKILYSTYAENAIYMRTLNNGTWTAWEKLPTRAEIDALNSKIVVINHYSVTVNDGYCRIPYPNGFDRFDTVLVQPVYSGGVLGWSSVLQLSTDDIVVYIRQGTTTPANGSVVSFKAIFIKA